MEASALTHASRGGLLGRRSPLLRLQGDERLVALIREGNEHAFEVLFDRYHSRLLAFCRHMLRSAEDAEDVLQEVFVKAHAAMLADTRAINARPWLYRIARNRCLNHLRRPVPEGQDSMDIMPAEGGVTTADRVQKREEFRALIVDVGDLPETQRTALLLREIDALSYEEIAAAMDTTIPAVKSLLVRARMSLAEATQSRHLTCGEVRLELAEAAEGLRKAAGPVRHHLKRCEPCREYRGELRENSKTLAALAPLGPLAIFGQAIIAKVSALLGGSGSVGGAGAATGAAGAAGSGAAVGTAAVAGAGAGAGVGAAAGVAGGGAALGGAAAAAGGGAIGAKAAATAATAAIIAAGAVEVRDIYGGAGVDGSAKQAPAQIRPAAEPVQVKAGKAHLEASAVAVATPPVSAEKAPTGPAPAPAESAAPTEPATAPVPEQVVEETAAQPGAKPSDNANLTSSGSGTANPHESEASVAVVTPAPSGAGAAPPPASAEPAPAASEPPAAPAGNTTVQPPSQAGAGEPAEASAEPAIDPADPAVTVTGPAGTLADSPQHPAG